MRNNNFTLMGSIAIALLLSVSCNENHVTVNPHKSGTATLAGPLVTNYTFTGKEGDPISLDSTKQWLANYNNLNPQGNSWFFGKQTMQAILAQSGCMGIRFFYAIDDGGNQQILMIGAGVDGHSLTQTGISGQSTSRLLSGGVGYYTGMEGNPVSASDAQRWITNFMNQNPTSIRAHFFGHEILNQILNENNCMGIRANYALNGAGVPQLLLIGTVANGLNILPLITPGARTEDGSGTVADMSWPCPSYCG